MSIMHKVYCNLLNCLDVGSHLYDSPTGYSQDNQTLQGVLTGSGYWAAPGFGCW